MCGVAPYQRYDAFLRVYPSRERMPGLSGNYILAFQAPSIHFLIHLRYQCYVAANTITTNLDRCFLPMLCTRGGHSAIFRTTMSRLGHSSPGTLIRDQHDATLTQHPSFHFRSFMFFSGNDAIVVTILASPFPQSRVRTKDSRWFTYTY